MKGERPEAQTIWQGNPAEEMLVEAGAGAETVGKPRIESGAGSDALSRRVRTQQ